MPISNTTSVCPVTGTGYKGILNCADVANNRLPMTTRNAFKAGVHIDFDDSGPAISASVKTGKRTFAACEL